MKHIIAPNQFRTQEDIMQSLDAGLGNWPEGNLLCENPAPPYFKSRKAYRQAIG